MTDRYENIRQALAMGPTPGPWKASQTGMRIEDAEGGLLYEAEWRPAGTRKANAAYVAACDPDTIRALLAERDALLSACKTALAWSDQDWVGYEQVRSAVGMANATAAGSPMREGGDHD